ncbi:MAG TPA: XdhC family protein [Solirubrobacteraceae bacterium]
MITGALSRRAAQLVEERAPFVLATVVRAQRPTSVRPADAAIVLGDGSIEGFVGGACAEQSVRLHALRALETGEGILLRIVPGDDDAPAAEGAITVSNPCLSGGALEIFLEPVVPQPRILLIGSTPTTEALARLAPELGLDTLVVSDGSAAPGEGDLAVVAASHGRDELPALRGALAAGVPYVGLVASRRRGAAVLAELRQEGVDPALLDLVDTPAGLDIGARTPGEIAVSILATIIEVRRRGAGAAPTTGRCEVDVTTQLDPVCGMAVAATADAPNREHAGRTFYFCCEGCRDTFAADPSRFVVAP